MMSRRKFDTIFWWVLLIVACALIFGITSNLEAQEPINASVYETGTLITCGTDSVFIYRDLIYGVRQDTLMILIRRDE